MPADRQTPLAVKVWGELACFTRPEMKVERVTYPVMTPSAARGVLEAIFWKPQFDWRVQEIQVLKPIRYFSILRNEIASRQTVNVAQRWEEEGGGFYATEDRQQRHTLALRDVAYIIRAQIDVKEGVGDDPAKFRDQFRRRVAAGRCFATPYLGCREFSAAFATPSGDELPKPISEDLGHMLLRMDYDPDGSGKATPRFFPARLNGGVMRVPDTTGGEE